MAQKREVQINVRMSAEDYATLERAAERLWRGAKMSRSSLVLSLALLGAEGGKPPVVPQSPNLSHETRKKLEKLGRKLK